MNWTYTLIACKEGVLYQNRPGWLTITFHRPFVIEGTATQGEAVYTVQGHGDTEEEAQRNAEAAVREVEGRL